MRPSALAWLLSLGLAGCTPQPSFEELRSSGYQALERGDLAAARAAAERGRGRATDAHDAAWERVSTVLLAEVLVDERRDTEAIAILEPVVHAGPTKDEVHARAAMTLGRARCRQGRAEGRPRSEAELDEAERLASGLGSDKLSAEVARHRGACALSRGDLRRAEEWLDRSLALARQARQPFLEAKALGSLGLLRVRTARYDEAADWLKRALDLTSALGVGLDTVKTLTNLGWCYYQLGDYDRALGFHTRAAAMAEERGYASERQIALRNLGNTYYRLRELGRAGEHYRRSLELARGLGEPGPIAELVSNLGVVALDQGRYDEAEASIAEALRINTEIEDVAGVQYSRLAEGLAWAGKGEQARAESRYREVLASPDCEASLAWVTRAALARLYSEQRRVAEAEAQFREAFALMERSYADLRAAAHRMSFFSSLDEFHDAYVDFLVARGRDRLALEVADRSRGRLLREMLHGGPELPRMGVARFQEAAGLLDAVILFYWLAPSRSYLWTVTPVAIQLHTLPSETEIRAQVDAHQALVLHGRDPLAEAAEPASWLYRTLVPPLARSLRPGARVIFVPDGPLHQLNPETLVATSPAPHYWLEDVTVLTAPSVSALAAAAKGKPRKARGPALLIGDPVPQGDEFPRLAHAARELAGIACQFRPSARSVYSGARAEPRAYRTSEPERFSFIHFAAHAQANAEVPLESAIVLTASDGSPKLYAHDVVKLQLTAELVTLSACRTAGARAFAGEGLVGLSWAFLSSGAANVVAGLWNVEDASTAELMTGLYRNLVADQVPPAEALRLAKLDLRRSDAAFAKPYYWAPFMIYTRGSRPTATE